MSGADILNKILEYKGLNVKALSELIGMDRPQGLYDIQKGKTRSISHAMANKIISVFPDLNLAWLLSGEGNMLNDARGQRNDLTQGQSSPMLEYDYTVKEFFKDYYSYLDYTNVSEMLLKKQLSNLTEDEMREIAGVMNLDYNDLSYGIEVVTTSGRTGKVVPVYNHRASAGDGVVGMDGSREGWVNIGDLLKDSEGSLYVYGNSMIPGYPPGTLIGIRPLNESFIEPGSVYVVETESNRYVKRLYYNDDNSAA